MGIVLDRQAEIVMAEPAALHRANQRFPGRAATSALTGEASCAARSWQLRAAARPAVRSALN
jgi:hypothetical protein